MRPVSKGGPGPDSPYGNYLNARRDLIAAIGEYCSYCEMHLDAGLAVEHKVPKSREPDTTLQNEWSNLLLACPNCNSCKGDRLATVSEPIWPDCNNTFYALTYGPGARVTSNPLLSGYDRSRAEDLLELVQLNRSPADTATFSDRRWLNRHQAWDMAVESLQDLQRQSNAGAALKRQIVKTALAKGYWSIWMTVFSGEGDVVCELIDKFPGTARECFDLLGRTEPQIDRNSD